MEGFGGRNYAVAVLRIACAASLLATIVTAQGVRAADDPCAQAQMLKREVRHLNDEIRNYDRQLDVAAHPSARDADIMVKQNLDDVKDLRAEIQYVDRYFLLHPEITAGKSIESAYRAQLTAAQSRLDFWTAKKSQQLAGNAALIPIPQSYVKRLKSNRDELARQRNDARSKLTNLPFCPGGQPTPTPRAGVPNLNGLWKSAGALSGTYQITQEGGAIKMRGISLDEASAALFSGDFTGTIQGHVIKGNGGVEIRIVDPCKLELAGPGGNSMVWTKKNCRF
jgi:hypothetical protein